MSLRKFLIAVLLIICISLCGCNNATDVENNDQQTDPIAESTDTQATDDSSEIKDINDTISKFEERNDQFVTETKAEFILQIEDNPIDAAYLSQIPDSSTADMVEYETKYTEIWMQELEFSYERFLALLNERDKETFSRLQDEWEENLKEEYDFIYGIFSNGNTSEYGIRLGSVFSVSHAYDYRIAIRERTLYLKYLEYCMHLNDEEMPEITFKFEAKTDESDTSSSTDSSAEYCELSNETAIEIAKNCFLTISAEFNETEVVSYKDIFYYFTFDACYTPDRKGIPFEVVHYYDGEKMTFSIPYKIADSFLEKRFNTKADRYSIEYFNADTECYEFDQNLGEFYYDTVLMDKKSLESGKYSFTVKFRHTLTDTIPVEYHSFTVEMNADGYKILSRTVEVDN